jgi:succinoglycan biosynthesis protein ExoM
MTKVQILVCSKDRIDSLNHLLKTLARNYGVHSSLCVSILLVDASPEPYNLESLQTSAFPLVMNVVRCETVGVAIARNTALLHKNSQNSYFAFIDDDEYPSPEWLEALVSHAETGNYLAVGGPVHPKFPKNHTRNYLDEFYFHRLHSLKGKITSLATGNLLLSNRLFTSVDILPYFDERLNFSGGEDAEFTQRIRKNFGDSALGWTEDALVFESIPHDRISIVWLVNRAFSLGKSTAALKKILGEFPHVRIASIFLNTCRSIYGFSKHLLRGNWKHAIVYMLYMQAVAYGQFVGLIGFKSYHYRNQSH